MVHRKQLSLRARQKGRPMNQITERFGIATQFGKRAPCRIEGEGTDRSGRRFLTVRYYDADGYYNSTVDLAPAVVQEVDYRPAPHR